MHTRRRYRRGRAPDDVNEEGARATAGRHLAIQDHHIIGEIGATSPQQKRTITLKAGKHTEVLEWRIDEIAEQLPELSERLKDLAWRRVSDWFE